ncbi:hypothetical protein ACFL2J_05600 [Candidatus Omnitrophota bacterium]
MGSEDKTKDDLTKTSEITSVSDYRKMLGQVKIVTCPSGVKVKVKRLTPMDYINEGLADIPNEFFRFITELSAGKIDSEDKEAKKNYDLFEKFLTITVEKGIVDPPVLIKYKKGDEETHLIFGEFTQKDQKFLIDVITGRVDIDG